MWKNKLSRSLAGGLASLVAVLAGGVLLAPAAHAADIGTAAVTPATGSDTSSMSLTTSGPCPDTATNVIVSVTGSGFPAGGQNVVGNSPIGTYGSTPDGGLVIPLSQTMRDYANTAGFTNLTGKYTFTVTCRTAFNGTSLGDFPGAVWFTSNTAYQNTDPAAVTDTTTSLAVSPAGPVDAGTPVTLTANVGPAGAAGTVQFRDNGAALGNPVAVSGGQAALTTSSLGAGNHSLTAVFTPSSAAYNGSTSTAVAYTVDAAPATATTTALAVSPSGTAAQYSPVSMTASVAPASAAGSVKFQDTVGGTTTTLATVPVAAGQASFTTSSLAPGDHSFSATFVPANAAAYLGSDSGAVPFVVGAFAGVTASQDITTTVEAGALVISVDNPHVTLPSPQLNANGDLLATTGAINAVTLTDTRAGNPGWSVSGQVTDFSDGGTHLINGQNLGWTPKVIDKGASQTVTAGAAVAAANGVAPADAGTAGLKSSRSLANGTGLGTAHVGADLALNAPTSTVAGTYTATLTLTAI
ncbi:MULTISPECIES: Ig-like domain repeat protein [unclassified Streptomyces]|uniref:Ig-like domain repeat protein n=1 Tax=unclassified Streptomyces TaxID=2593676 RepID=UPI00365F3D31